MELQQGNIYNKKSNQLVLKYYDPLFISKNYFKENEKMFLKAGNKHFEVGLNHTDGFEDINHVRDLINENRRWTGMSLLSPAAKNVKDYTSLSQCVEMEPVILKIIKLNHLL